ncbi:hypothetical protein CBL_08796 [Carabus blaptoides fortunei]
MFDGWTVTVDSSKQAAQILQQPVASRSPKRYNAVSRGYLIRKDVIRMFTHTSSIDLQTDQSRAWILESRERLLESDSGESSGRDVATLRSRSTMRLSVVASL